MKGFLKDLFFISFFEAYIKEWVIDIGRFFNIVSLYTILAWIIVYFHAYLQLR